MARKITPFFPISLLFILVFSIAGDATTIFVPEHYATIQEAVNAANSGDIIIVNDGTYIENVKINKDGLTIMSVSGPDKTFIEAKDPGDDILRVMARYVTISGFTVQNVASKYTEHPPAGMSFTGASYCTVSNNIFTNNVWGVNFVDSVNNILSGNEITGNNSGIVLSYQSSSNAKNIIRNNTVTYNKLHGVYLVQSYGTILEGNIISSNGGNGIFFNGQGKNNIIRKNIVSHNKRCGIYINRGYQDNIIYLNNFVENGETAYGGYSRFYSNSKINYIYNGKTYTNYLGNYWSKHVDIDKDDDGIVDVSCSIITGEDYYPLVKRFENYTT